MQARDDYFLFPQYSQYPQDSWHSQDKKEQGDPTKQNHPNPSCQFSADLFIKVLHSAIKKEENPLSLLDEQLLEQSEIGRIPIIKELVKKGANPDAKNEKGETPLHQAASKGHWITIKILLKAKANKYASTLNGETPMAYAIKNDKLKAVQTLVQSGYGINYQDEIGKQTPLANACTYRRLGIAKYLLAQGALMTPEIIFKVKTLPVLELSQQELELNQTIPQPEEVLVPCTESIDFLIEAGANKRKIRKLITDQSEVYCNTNRMTSHIWAEFVEIERELSQELKWWHMSLSSSSLRPTGS